MYFRTFMIYGVNSGRAFCIMEFHFHPIDEEESQKGYKTGRCLQRKKLRMVQFVQDPSGATWDGTVQAWVLDQMKEIQTLEEGQPPVEMDYEI